MNVLLIVPSVRVSRKPSRFPVGLASVAAVLEDQGIGVDVLDLNVLRLSPAQEREKITEAISHSDVVGMGGMITMLREIGRIAEIVKECRPSLPIMVGGPIALHFREIILRHTCIDVLVSGEGEQVASLLVQALAGQGDVATVRGVAFLQDGALVTGPAPERVEDLDSLPMPAYHLFDLRRYVANRGQPATCDIIASRGCPFQCTFCHRNFGNRVVFRSVDSVIGEIRFLKNFYAIEHVHIEDELFIQREDYVTEFCSEMRRLGGITWDACGRANMLSPELLREARASGCEALMIGLESFSDDRLKEMKKGVTAAQNEQACRWMNEAGIRIAPGLLIGMPGETRERLSETVEACIRHRIPVNQWSLAFVTPYPGTGLYEQAKASGMIDDDWQYIQTLCDAGDTRNLALNMTDLGDDELVQLRASVIQTINAALSGPDRLTKGKMTEASLLRRVLHWCTRKGAALKLLLSHNSTEPEGARDESPFATVRKEHFDLSVTRDAAMRLFAESVEMVEVEVFSYCNRACWFCSNSVVDRRSGNVYMDESVFRRIINDLREIEYGGILSFSRYNEPLADSIIYERLAEAKQSLPAALLHANTNGDYLKGDTIHRLYEAGLRSLGIQVYMDSKQGYSDQLAEKMIWTKICELGLPYKLKRAGIMNRLEYELEYQDMKVRIYARNFARNGVDRGGIVKNIGDGHARRTPCLVPFKYVYVDYTGMVVPCCNIRSDIEGHKAFVLGDLSRDSASLFDIYGAAAEWRRSVIRYDDRMPVPCRNCAYHEVPRTPGRCQQVTEICRSAGLVTND